jgi:hypothetical protein
MINTGRGKLLRKKILTSTQTWTRPTDVGSVFVEVVGGGGGSQSAAANNGSAGGTSSFGAFVSATGGSGGGTTGGGGTGAGGNGSGGDCNVAGDDGGQFYGLNNLYPKSFLGNNFGAGGAAPLITSGGAWNGSTRVGGGAGGYAGKFIDDPGSSVAVTVGAGGSSGGAGGYAGKAGVVIIYEYAK